MNFWDSFMIKWDGLKEKMSPFFQKVCAVFRQIDKALVTVWRYIVALKKVFITIPVAVAAIILAIRNMAALPEVVGLDLQANAAFAIQVTRGIAVFCPLILTLMCLLLVFCSRRTLTPWFVSVVSLLIPVVILISNTFPA